MHFHVKFKGMLITALWEVDISLFTLRKPHSLLIIIEERGFPNVDRLFARSQRMERRNDAIQVWCAQCLRGGQKTRLT